MTFGTLVLVVIAAFSATAIAILRRCAWKKRSQTFFWVGLAVTLLVAMFYLVALMTRLVPITPVNFAIILLGIIYFGILECMRIHRDIAAIQR